MFSKETYISRRQELEEACEKRRNLLFFGNNNSPCNFPSNGYYPSVRLDIPLLFRIAARRSGRCNRYSTTTSETLIGDDIDY